MMFVELYTFNRYSSLWWSVQIPHLPTCLSISSHLPKYCNPRHGPVPINNVPMHGAPWQSAHQCFIPVPCTHPLNPNLCNSPLDLFNSITPIHPTCTYAAPLSTDPHPVYTILYLPLNTSITHLDLSNSIVPYPPSPINIAPSTPSVHTYALYSPSIYSPLNTFIPHHCKLGILVFCAANYWETQH